jgi:heme/copper-type cytochrome/quinol oxidase subunit 1
MNLVMTLLGNEIPTLVVVFIIAGVVQIFINRILADLGVYNYVWHPGLFRTALFVCIFVIPSLLIYK